MEIKFKATRRKHSSDWAEIEKSGGMKYDQDRNANDGIWLCPKNGDRIFIDCDYKTKVFTLHFNEEDFELNSESKD